MDIQIQVPPRSTPPRRWRGWIALALAAAVAGEATAQAGQFEKARMERLAAVQADPANRLAPFETDGCSGGLSTGWRWLAERIPAFQRARGEQPPWESCCVDHDRVYWRGETEDGYRKRAAADEALRQCVVSTGERLSGELSQRDGVSPEEVEESFRQIANLMHAAVRTGGDLALRSPGVGAMDGRRAQPSLAETSRCRSS